MAKRKTSSKVHLEAMEDRLDDVLFECLEILKKPAKKRLTNKGIFDVYPVPMISNDGFNLLGVQYLQHRNILLPDSLWSRYLYWDELLEQSHGRKKRGRPALHTTVDTNLLQFVETKPIYKNINRQKRGYSQEDVDKWARSREAGLTLKQIANEAGCSIPTISSYLKKHTA